MKLKELFKVGVEDPLGYKPVSNGIKPVHIANGLCRATLGEYYDPRLLNRTLNRWARREERHSTDDIVAEATERFGEFASPDHRERLNELRELLRGVMGADGAVFDKNDMCSYTLTHRTHVTSDRNDWRTGRFLYQVLSADLGGGPSPSLALLKKLLSDDSDEISILSLPLTADEEPRSAAVDDDIADALETKGVSEGVRTFRSPILREIRLGFDTLAQFERAQGSKLHSLRRLVAFATFSVFLHIINRSLDYEDGRSFLRRRPPLLLDFMQEGWSPVAVASYATYNLACKSIGHMIEHGIRAALAGERQRWSTTAAETFISEIELGGGDRLQERKRAHFLESFRSYSASNAVAEALCLATVDTLLQDMSGTPYDFARMLGVRGGLLAPRARRAVKKRYAPSPELLEVLLASVVSPGEDLDLVQLGDRLWDRYGVLTGARPGDAAELARWSILDATKEDLVRNGHALQTMLIEIGYAKRYADGVTVIRLAGGAAA
jgi:hypothetical protein